MASWKVEAVVDNFDTTSIDIFFCCRTGMDAVSKVATEGATLSMCTISPKDIMKFAKP